MHLVYYAFDLLHLDGRGVSALPLIERKALLEPLVANKPGLQFNGHDSGDGELILQHAGKLGFEGVVSKTIDAPYAPGNRGLWRKAKALNRQEFVVVGWSDPEGSRPHLGAPARLLHRRRQAHLCGPCWHGNASQGARRCTAPPGAALSKVVASQRPAAPVNPVRIAACSFPRRLGRTEACRGDHVFDLDGRQPATPHCLHRPPRGQAGGPSAARSRATLRRERRSA